AYQIRLPGPEGALVAAGKPALPGTVRQAEPHIKARHAIDERFEVPGIVQPRLQTVAGLTVFDLAYRYQEVTRLHAQLLGAGGDTQLIEAVAGQQPSGIVVRRAAHARPGYRVMRADRGHQPEYTIAVADRFGELGRQACPGGSGQALQVKAAEHARLPDISTHARQNESGVLLHGRQLLLHEETLLVTKQHLGYAEHQEQAEGHGHHQLHQADAALCAPRSDHGCPPISAETVSEALPASASMRSSDQLNVTVAR